VGSIPTASTTYHSWWRRAAGVPIAGMTLAEIQSGRHAIPLALIGGDPTAASDPSPSWRWRIFSNKRRGRQASPGPRLRGRVALRQARIRGQDTRLPRSLYPERTWDAPARGVWSAGRRRGIGPSWRCASPTRATSPATAIAFSPRCFRPPTSPREGAAPSGRREMACAPTETTLRPRFSRA
jgi:hypothetical protein